MVGEYTRLQCCEAVIVSLVLADSRGLQCLDHHIVAGKVTAGYQDVLAVVGRQSRLEHGDVVLSTSSARLRNCVNPSCGWSTLASSVTKQPMRSIYLTRQWRASERDITPNIAGVCTAQRPSASMYQRTVPLRSCQKSPGCNVHRHPGYARLKSRGMGGPPMSSIGWQDAAPHDAGQ